MKRPILLCATCVLSISALCFIASVRAVAVAIILLFIIFAVLIYRGMMNPLVLLPTLAVTIVITLLTIREINLSYAVADLSGEKLLSGTVCDIVGYDESVGYIIETDSFDGTDIRCKARIVSTLGKQLSICDRVSMNVVLTTDSLSVYDLSEGIYCSGYLTELVDRSEGEPSPVYRLRSHIEDTITQKLSYRESSVILGVLLGEKDAMPKEIRDDFRLSGVSHIIVVSGLHLSVLAGGLYTLLRSLKISQRKTGIIGLAATVLLMVFMGLTVSVVRAGLTYIIMFSGLLIKRRPDPVSSLCCAITLITLHNPFAIMSVSFQLSCAATFGVLLVAPYFYEGKKKLKNSGIFRKFGRSVLCAVCITLSATIMTLPFTIYHFGTFIAVSVLTNVLISLAVSVLILLAVFAVAVSFVMPFLADMLLLAAGIISKIIIIVTEKIGKLPFAEINFSQPVIPAVVSAVVMVAFAVFYLKKYDKLIKNRKERAVQQWRP